MAVTATGILDSLLGRQEAAVLSAILRRPGERLYQRQLVRLTGLRLQQVQRALAHLTSLGILSTERDGNRVYYSADPACPLIPELRGLVLKTAGLGDVIREALKQVAGVSLAFIYGSFAKGTADTRSDVDVLIVADASFSDVSSALSTAEERLSREVNFTLYPPEEFREKLEQQHHFLMRVMAEPKIRLIGDPDDFAGVG